MPATTASEDLGAAADLDCDGFEAFYHRTSGGLWRYLRRVGGDPTLAEDLVQESYLRFLRQTHIVPDERQRTAYLYKIATNLLRDRWRRHKREEEGRVHIENRRRRDRIRQVDLGHDLGKGLATLSQRERSLLWLAYVEGYDHREIGEILGLRATSVRVLLFRARGRATKVLRQQGWDPSAEEAS